MRMHFLPDEAEPFGAAKQLLARRHEAWARSKGLPCDRFVTDSALDVRHHSIDGRLGFWTAEIVRGYLLEWMPRRVSATAEDAAVAPEALRSLLRYLHETELNDPTGAPLPELEAAIDAAAQEFPEAMSDTSRFGVAKFWTMRALAAGVDVSDPQAMMRFSQRADVDRAGLDTIMARQLRDGGGVPQQAPPQPPITLPTESELIDAATASPLLRRVRELVEWVGEHGRPLTGTGKLKLTDARVLVEALQTGDTIDPAIGERTFRTTSSAELVHLTLIVELAKKARLVRVVKNRLVRIARARRLLDDTLALWDRLFTTICETADVVVPPHRYFGHGILYGLYAETVPDLLNSLYGMPPSMPVLRLEEPIWQHAREIFTIDDGEPQHRETWRRMLHGDLMRTLRILAELGAVELATGSPDPMFSADLDDDPETDAPQMPLPDEARTRLRDALTPGAAPVDLATLTTLGHRAVRDRLLAAGRHAPLVGQLTAATAAQLLGTVAEHYSPETGTEEIGRWLAAHGGEGAGTPRLLDAIRCCPFRSRAAAMLDVLAATRAEPLGWLRSLRSDPELGPLAVNRLVRDGELPFEELTEPEGRRGMAEQFIQLLEVGGTDAASETLARLPTREREDTLAAILDSGHSDTAGLSEIRALAAEQRQDANVHPLAGVRRRRSRTSHRR